jgi:hypothetical protein
MPTITKSFNYTGQLQIADLPAGTSTVTMHLWGGAGGCGGPDTAGDGADGAAGHYVTVTDLDVSAYAGAKKICVAVGGGGESGGMGQDTAGGRNGQSLTGYSGGDGGNSGRGSGESGSGGGGGGATTVTLFESGQSVDNIILAIAGGGGGGGGTGESSRGGAGINSNSPTGNTPGTLGENGAGHAGDGGGGGAGGGGADGGTGGSGATGDAGGFGGYSGSNTVPVGGSENNGSGETPGGTDSAYYSTGVAKGGIGGLAGGSGKAVLIFTVPSESKVKHGGEWKSFDSINYKVSWVWKKVTEGFYKVGGVWKNIFTTDIEFLGNSIGFGNASGGSTSGSEGTGGLPTVATIPPQEGGDTFIPPPAKKYTYIKDPQTDTVEKTETAHNAKGIVCTMMNQTAGFGTFRNRIWHKFWEEKGSNGRKGSTQNYRMEKGYHTVFLPLVRLAKKDGNVASIVRKILTHMGRHVTADFYGEMRNRKRDNLGRVYRAIFEPMCWAVGKFKKKRTNLHRLAQPINKHKE